MIILDTTSKSLEIVLASTPTNQFDWTVSYIEITSNFSSSASNDGTTNSATAVTMVAAPSSASTQRQIKYITAINNDIASQQVKIQMNVAATIRILCVVTLQPGDTLQYSDSEGFNVIAYNSGIKTLGVNNMLFAAGSNSSSSGNMIFSNSNNFTFGLSGATTTTATTANVPQQLTLTGSFQRNIAMSAFEVPFAKLSGNTALSTSNAASYNLSLQRLCIPYDITATRLDLLAALTVNGSTAGTWSVFVGFYTRTGSTLNSFYTTSSNLQFNSGGATSNTNSYSGISGTRLRSFSLGAAPNSTWGFTPGEYWFGCMNFLTNPTGTSGQVTFYGNTSFSVAGVPGGDNDNNGNMGLFTVATGSFPSTINITNGIAYCGSVSNATQAMRQPYFRMFGTYG